MTYQSMSRIRFSSATSHEQFKTVFSQTDACLKALPGFVHQTWWSHASDPLLHVQVSFWRSEDDLKTWLAHPYHQRARKWVAQSAAVMEVIVTDFELKSTLLVRLCPTCGDLSEVPYDTVRERQVLASPCPVCDFHYPVTAEAPDHAMIWGDRAEDVG